MEILLIRHGQTHATPQDFNPELDYPDPPLTATGVWQAERLGARLSCARIQRIYASDLLRARQTAQILSQYVPAPLEIRPQLREIHMGRLHHTTWEQIKLDSPGVYEEWVQHRSDLPYPGGECGQDVKKRAFPLLYEILERGEERVALVSHGGTIRTLLCAVLEIPLERRFFFGAPLANCGLSVLRWDPAASRFIVHTVNDAAHLEETAAVKPADAAVKQADAAERNAHAAPSQP